MIQRERIPIHRLILSLAEAMDFGHPAISEHHRRVAYFSVMIGRELDLECHALANLFHAALLHDIGLIRVEDRIRVIHLNQLEDVQRHAEIGYQLLRDNELLGHLAPIVRHHHAAWPEAHRNAAASDGVPLASYIIAVADEVERGIDRKADILNQFASITATIREAAGKRLHPDCVAAFLNVCQPESFWLDSISDRLYGLLLQQVDWPTMAIDEETLQPIAALFGQVTDAASRWTGTHSAGVSASAVALAEKLRFSPREVLLMRAAGHLHDIGKLTIPNRILDKPAALNREEVEIMRGHTYHTFHILQNTGGMGQACEWAAFHHERLDGRGYPFRHRSENLTLGARIMAVADVFTALTEDRPYRKGLGRGQAQGILATMVSEHALDGDVVSVLTTGYDEIDALRRRQQAAYSLRQAGVAEVAEQSAAA